ncbi:conserved hypothetical protein [Ricinus communis]|uniref:Uncharacterized protein n=1 Tax=Ricinus communis TaxID=3988 RepID=B9T818_RICCO|nr:conserved hypothetical protein [Ricinus communis]
MELCGRLGTGGSPCPTCFRPMLLIPLLLHLEAVTRRRLAKPGSNQINTVSQQGQGNGRRGKKKQGQNRNQAPLSNSSPLKPVKSIST